MLQKALKMESADMQWYDVGMQDFKDFKLMSNTLGNSVPWEPNMGGGTGTLLSIL
jgi:hypothetical protein